MRFKRAAYPTTLMFIPFSALSTNGFGILRIVRALVQFGGRVGILCLIAVVLVQPFCPALLLRAEPLAVAPPEYSDCHESMPSTPAPPPAKKCCSVNHSQASMPGWRYVAPQVCVIQKHVSGEFQRTFLQLAPEFGWQFSTSDLARSSPILRI